MIFIALILACNSEPGGKEDAGPGCIETETALAGEEATSLGLTANDVSGLVVGAFAHPLFWADGTSTTVTLLFTPTGNAWFVDSEQAPSNGGTEPAIYAYCDDRLDVETALTFATDDGAFDESWTLRLSATEAGSASVVQPLDLDGLDGTFDLLPFVDATGWDALRGWVDVSVLGSGISSGEIRGQASGEDDCPDEDDCAAWAENVEVATWVSGSE